MCADRKRINTTAVPTGTRTAGEGTGREGKAMHRLHILLLVLKINNATKNSKRAVTETVEILNSVKLLQSAFRLLMVY